MNDLETKLYAIFDEEIKALDKNIEYYENNPYIRSVQPIYAERMAEDMRVRRYEASVLKYKVRDLFHD